MCWTSAENFKRLSASFSLSLSVVVCDDVTGVCVVVAVADEAALTLDCSRFAADATFFLSCGDANTRLFSGS